MKIGIISDTHDNLPAIKLAVDFFNDAGVDAVFHCGDIVAPFAMLSFKQLLCRKVFGIFGNNDGEKEGIKKLAKLNGWRFEEQPLLAELGGRKIAVVHEPEKMNSLLEDDDVDVILWGHLHRSSFETRNNKIVLNPGEGGGWVHGRATVALLDLDSLKAEFHVMHLGVPEAL